MLKSFINLLIILFIFSTLSFTQIIEIVEDDIITTDSKFVITLKINTSMLSFSGDLLEYINNNSDKSTSNIGFGISLETLYKLSPKLKGLLEIGYTLPIENTYTFTLATDNTIDSFQGIYVNLGINYFIKEEAEFNPFIAIGATVTKSKYDFTGTFMTTDNNVIPGNIDYSCMMGFGFFVRAGIFLSDIPVSVSYQYLIYQLNDDSFEGFLRSFNVQYITLSIGINVI